MLAVTADAGFIFVMVLPVKEGIVVCHNTETERGWNHGFFSEVYGQ